MLYIKKNILFYSVFLFLFLFSFAFINNANAEIGDCNVTGNMKWTYATGFEETMNLDRFIFNKEKGTISGEVNSNELNSNITFLGKSMTITDNGGGWSGKVSLSAIISGTNGDYSFVNGTITDNTDNIGMGDITFYNLALGNCVKSGVDLQTTKTSVNYRDTITLSWTTSNITSGSCELDGVSVSDNDSLNKTITSPTTFELTCLSLENIVKDSVIIELLSSGTINSFSADPTSLPVGGGTTTLSWSTSNIDSCTLNGVSVLKNSSLSKNITETTIFELMCKDVNDLSVSQEITILVESLVVPVEDIYSWEYFKESDCTIDNLEHEYNSQCCINHDRNNCVDDLFCSGLKNMEEIFDTLSCSHFYYWKEVYLNCSDGYKIYTNVCKSKIRYNFLIESDTNIVDDSYCIENVSEKPDRISDITCSGVDISVNGKNDITIPNDSNVDVTFKPYINNAMCWVNLEGLDYSDLNLSEYNMGFYEGTRAALYPSNLNSDISFKLSVPDEEPIMFWGFQIGTRAIVFPKTFNYEYKCYDNVADSRWPKIERATVTVLEDSVDIDISTNPDKLYVGESTTISWKAAEGYLSDCDVYGLPGTDRANVGSEIIILGSTGYKYFKIECKDDLSDRLVSASTFVEVDYKACIQGQSCLYGLCLETGFCPLDNNINSNLSIVVSPDTIEIGESVNISWASRELENCVASGDWRDNKNPNGNEIKVIDTPGTKTFTITCDRLDGTGTETDYDTINVMEPIDESSLSINASPNEITIGESVNISWTSEGLENCVASDYWNGYKNTSGTNNIVIDTIGTKIFTITCDRLDGTGIETAYDTVIVKQKFAWVLGDYGSCDANGFMTASYSCYNQTLDRLALSESSCPVPKPLNSRITCYDWYIGEYKDCYDGVRERLVECRLNGEEDGTLNEDGSFCSSSSKPNIMTICPEFREV